MLLKALKTGGLTGNGFEEVSIPEQCVPRLLRVCGGSLRCRDSLGFYRRETVGQQAMMTLEAGCAKLQSHLLCICIDA